MKRDLTCIICPRGCSLHVEGEGKALTVSGNACPRGIQYAVEECTDPRRTITSTVRVSNRENCMVSVKTADPIPKAAIFEIMACIRQLQVEAPLKIGDLILDDVYGTQIIATKAVE